ncbi:uncharacterized protein LOC129584390 isoform X2 [Paramacrobiotus metropolitanus]|uniref:uncharacterized protein LOC129584390 isoform X2 n=1 Tax=Paramacrobiotus metropolitanus TaxID=2943436 RepID=UPI002445D1AF|nr:uncharacterized protein LOC129584390 isoform X2 [Paramacrobiotus metropolitanus]
MILSGYKKFGASSCFLTSRPRQECIRIILSVWDDDLNFFTWRIGPDDTSAMKCCTTPKGYYIDYGSCYYSPTHDQFGEFYDSNFMFLVYCSPGNVMTGMAKKLNPSSLGYNIDWIQCCRLGYGVPQVVSPPVTQSYSGHPTYYAKEQYYPSQIPSGYQAQYRSLSGSSDATGNQTRFSQKRMWFQNKPDVEDSGSYKNSFALDGPYNSAVKL